MLDVYNSTYQQMTGEGGPFETVVEEVRGIPVKVYKAAPPNMRVLWELSALHGDKAVSYTHLTLPTICSV